jgi:hydroxymethylpyrimidine/phosphomethylpyrimidine kinase
VIGLPAISRILIIAGSDSGGGAGIQADIKTVTMLGGHAMTAITAITAQNTVGVQAVHPVPAEMVVAQIRSVVSDIGVDAVKIGMIGSAATAHAVAEELSRLAVPIVFDPVMIATSGDMLADTETIGAFERLMRMATITTPNVPELEALTGMAIHNVDEMETAAQDLRARFGCGVLAKGGHLGDQPGDARPAVHDLLVTEDGTEEFHMPRLVTTSTHGTGCTLASALAAGLGRGMKLREAVDRAEAFVAGALHHAPGLGQGHGPLGHAFGTTPFYHVVAARNHEGMGAGALAAQWGDDV